MALMVFSVSVCAETETGEEAEIVRTKALDCGVTLYKTTEGTWGAYGDNFEIDPVYYLPCSSAYYYDFNDTFILASVDCDVINNKMHTYNTYYVFNSKGELIKTLTYSFEDIQAENPNGCASDCEWFWAVTAYGSNLVFAEAAGKINVYDLAPCYIKRLYSEKVADGYYAINRYEDGENGEFIAYEKDTFRKCILNADGSFKEYILNDDGSYKVFSWYS